MSRCSLTIFLILATSLLAPDLLAKTELPENWHQIEVIIFAQQDLTGEEAFPENPLLAFPDTLQFLQTAEQLSPDVTNDASYNETLAALMVPERFLNRDTAILPASFVPLDKDIRKLNADSYRLSRNKGYRVVFHNAWQQAVLAGKSSKSVFITGGETIDGHRELEGSLKIFKSRFYHIDVNLWLSQFIPASSGTTESPPMDSEPLQALKLPDLPTPSVSQAVQRLNRLDELNNPIAELQSKEEIYQVPPPSRFQVKAVDTLETSKQISLNSLTYIDHPRMGILVLITPILEEEEPPETLE